MTNASLPADSTSAALQAGGLPAMLSALRSGRYFKLIGGGSLTEAERLAAVARAYALAGVDCLDLAPEPAVLAAVEAALVLLPQPHPVIMISLPLDPDPHFRKIDLNEPGCIRCGLCLPVCPTDAIALPDALAITQSLCYGCGRCVPVCPTDALSLLPFQVESQIETVLANPLVQAVEIHSRYVDPYMLEAFFERWGAQLHGKLLSLCFRLEGIPAEQMLAFYEMACRNSTLPVMLQVDGAPMSGNDNPEASRPALEVALQVADMFQQAGKALPLLTISGGINRHTAEWLRDPRYAMIAGVGMGTVARKAVWTEEAEAAVQIAAQVVNPFRER